ncbi:MAG: citrate (Si)-synthase, partial [Bacteroidetes bacterium]|nr:citrate (Si)-synthase [Bacteroidota bacterium]
MADQVELIYKGEKYTFPVVHGSENEAAVDIKNLRAKTGLITLDPGFKNTGACQSEITFLNGEEGILRYRGYDIEDLANNNSFIEVAYLLIFGDLPTTEQLDQFEDEIREYALVDEDFKIILKSFPKSAHPMGILSSLTSALIAFNPSSVDINSEKEFHEAIIMLLAKFPVLASWTHRKMKGLPLNYPNYELRYTENLAHMMFRMPNKSFEPSKTLVSTLNKLLILHADHEQNCSTSTVRMVGSSHAGLFASIASGISALWGPL